MRHLNRPSPPYCPCFADEQGQLDPSLSQHLVDEMCQEGQKLIALMRKGQNEMAAIALELQKAQEDLKEILAIVESAQTGRRPMLREEK